jgi:lipopolysaccharide transport system ATP-binding protein
MTPIIRVENLSKQYRIGARLASYTTLRERLMEMIESPLKRWQGMNGATRDATIWALKDVSFEVSPGEVVGIVGRNGSGKSTLLKLLSLITEPTSGSVELYGRFGSLLEVGTGFHPELTGRENIYLNGAILGMSRAEIRQRFDEIVDFAEVDDFIDTPVKRYSSGMHLRLAFAVAAHLRTEILLIDEALSVGDTEFQKKCMGKVEGVAREGRTALFVSHNLGAVTHLCGRALWLNEGRLELDGDAREVVAGYFAKSYAGRHSWQRPPQDEGADSNSEACLLAARLCQQGREAEGAVSFDREFTIEVEHEVKRAVAEVSIVLRIVSESGTIIFTSSDVDVESEWTGRVRAVGRYLSACLIPGKLLKSGNFFVTVGARRRGNWIELRENLLRFEVSAVGNPLHPQRLGVITPLLDWEVKRLE